MFSKTMFTVLAALVLAAPGAASALGADGLQPAPSDEETYACTVTVGAPGVAFDASDDADAAVGGCNLVDLEEAGVVTGVFTQTDACRVRADVDGDGLAEAGVEKGTQLPAGASVWAFCDAGTFDETVAIKVLYD